MYAFKEILFLKIIFLKNIPLKTVDFSFFFQQVGVWNIKIPIKHICCVLTNSKSDYLWFCCRGQWQAAKTTRTVPCPYRKQRRLHWVLQEKEGC